MGNSWRKITERNHKRRNPWRLRPLLHGLRPLNLGLEMWARSHPSLGKEQQKKIIPKAKQDQGSHPGTQKGSGGEIRADGLDLVATSQICLSSKNGGKRNRKPKIDTYTTLQRDYFREENLKGRDIALKRTG